MSYTKATDRLPIELINLIQDYIDGEYIYIPRKESNRKAWGDTTKSKTKTSIRNQEIFKKYKEGFSTKELSEIYYLSPKTIQKIIANLKNEKS